MVKSYPWLKILVVEDNDGDFELIEELLIERFTTSKITRSLSFKEACSIIDKEESNPDLILLDLSLPDKSGENLIREIFRQTRLCCPVIILTGYSEVEFSISSIALGISDYLLKDELNGSLLYKSVSYALERYNFIKKLEESEKKYSTLFNLSPQPMWVYDSETLRFLQVNNAAVKKYGYSKDEFLNMTALDIRSDSERPAFLDQLEILKDSMGNVFSGEFHHRTKQGDLLFMEVYSSYIEIDGRPCRSVLAVDVSERIAAEIKLTKAIIKTQEDERYELGSELHDNVCQILAASQMHLGMLKHGMAGEQLVAQEKGLEYIKMALDEIRNLSHRLAPAFFEKTDLKSSFEQLVNTLMPGRTFRVEIVFDPKMSNLALSREMRLNLYRILQEQLNNITKYAQATYVKISACLKDRTVELRIADNGVGFDPDKSKGGIGLANMRRRAELFLGEFILKSEPGDGCEVIIRMPVPAEDSE